MSLPNPASHVWTDDHVGGATNDPAILLLDEENLMSNGDFSSAISGWSNESGTAPSRVDAGSLAARGNYVMRLQQSSVTHWTTSFTGTKILLTGWLKFITTQSTNQIDIDLYITGDASYVASPAAKFVSLRLESKDTYVDATGHYMPFYLELEATAGSYVHINFGTDAGVEVYIDDLRLHEVDERKTLYAPTIMSVRYQYI